MCLILFERVCGMMIWAFICDFEDLNILLLMVTAMFVVMLIVSAMDMFEL